MSVETDRRESVRAVVELRVVSEKDGEATGSGTLSLDGYFIGPDHPAAAFGRKQVVKIEISDDLVLEAEVRDAPGGRDDHAFLIFDDLDFEDVRALARWLDDQAYPDGQE
jgi:hypothetical protein